MAHGALPVVLLGLNAWLAAVLWPLLATAERAPGAYIAAGACLLPLVAGAVLHGRLAGAEDGERVASELAASTRRAHIWAAGAWLAAFPLACGVVLTAWRHASERALGTPGLVLSWLSLCAFAAAVARACGIRARPGSTPELALPDALAASPAAAPRRLRTAIIALCIGGGAALALVAPDLGALAPDADDTERAALVLTAVVGAALGCAIVAVFLAGALRSEAKPAQARLDGNLRAAWFVFVALLGAVVYYVVQP